MYLVLEYNYNFIRLLYELQKNHLNSPLGSFRVLRGGSFYDEDFFTQVAFRYQSYPDNSNINIGFRLVLPALE